METQPGLTVWLTGMSCAGKSTLARHLVARLRSVGRRVELLDEGEIDTLLPEPPHASRDVRDRNVRQLGEMAGLLTRNGVVVVVASMSPHKEARDEIRREIGRYVEIFVDCPFELLLERDSEGTYRKALQGQLQNVVGVQAPYETSPNYELVVDTSRGGVDTLGVEIFEKLSSHGYLTREESRTLIDGQPFELKVVDEDPFFGDDEEEDEAEDDRWGRGALRLVTNSEFEGTVTSRIEKKPASLAEPIAAQAKKASVKAFMVPAEAGAAEAGAAKAGAAKAGAAKAGAAKAGAAKAGTAQAGAAKAGTPKAGTPKAGTPKAGTPKAGTAKAGTAKAVTAEAGSAKAGAKGAGAETGAEAGAAKARTAKTGTAKTAAVKPAAVKTAAVKTAAGKTAAGKTAAGKTAAAKSVAAKSVAAKSVAAKSVAAKSVAAKSVAAKTGAAKTGATTGAAKTGTTTGAAKTGAAKTGAAKTAAAKTAAAKTGAAKTGAAKTSTAKTGAAKTRVAKAGAAKVHASDAEIASAGPVGGSGPGKRGAKTAHPQGADGENGVPRPRVIRIDEGSSSESNEIPGIPQRQIAAMDMAAGGASLPSGAKGE